MYHILKEYELALKNEDSKLIFMISQLTYGTLLILILYMYWVHNKTISMSTLLQTLERI